MQANNKIRKRFSQNFLVDENIIKKILHSIDPNRTEHFVEIGVQIGTEPIGNWWFHGRFLLVVV